jgi:hypothetical protein
VWLFRVAELFGYDFQTILHFADAKLEETIVQIRIKTLPKLVGLLG